ncbi:hypothetical protein E2562_010709 [Oryza meyeriana var. granulata]|uniref:Uncharacterized protein n=1 Tax=Oryza meyeriana var. granulata TaxID=110450 RepID=A0A6G1EW55_9ORYZ|nr:hypothetical protein E2562_010709 [Oryza meyeriana var. granulata]
MDVYISEEYVAKRRAEKRAAAAGRAGLAGDGEEGKARGGGGGGETGESRRTRWTAAWADGSEKGKGGGHVVGAVAGRDDDVILSYFSA